MQEITKFQEYLVAGQVGESRIANWLKRRGNSILPVYELEIENGKGPRLFTPLKNLIAPDMLALCSKETIWIEAKHKTAFTWYRIGQCWCTGINLRHYRDYCEIEDTTPFRVWLLFLHEGGHAKDSPPDSPSGLFGRELSYLKEHEDHRWIEGGMVYWNIGELKKLANISEL